MSRVTAPRSVSNAMLHGPRSWAHSSRRRPRHRLRTHCQRTRKRCVRSRNLAGYRDGHQVIPIPDGSYITAHVAVDACAAAGEAAGADSTVLMRQADALRALGLNARRPPLDLSHSDPTAYVHALSRASQALELLEPSSLGSFWWLTQAKGCLLPLPGIGSTLSQGAKALVEGCSSQHGVDMGTVANEPLIGLTDAQAIERRARLGDNRLPLARRRFRPGGA